VYSFLCKDVLQRCVDKWGFQMQLNIVVEELSELIKEICKARRGNENQFEIIDEIADVTIMLEQAKLIFEITEDELQDRMKFKVSRIEERLNRP
jgi:predicted nucleic acid-binding protein